MKVQNVWSKIYLKDNKMTIIFWKVPFRKGFPTLAWKIKSKNCIEISLHKSRLTLKIQVFWKKFPDVPKIRDQGRGQKFFKRGVRIFFLKIQANWRNFLLIWVDPKPFPRGYAVVRFTLHYAVQNINRCRIIWKLALKILKNWIFDKN